MNAHATIRTILLLGAAVLPALAQNASPVAPTAPSPHRPKPHPHAYQAPWNASVILLDPAHGGADDGAKLGSASLEKDFNAAFAERLRGLLAAQNFTVVLTHAAATDEVAPDARVEIANRSRAVACLLLHASNAGHGVHLFASSLTEPSSAGDARPDTYIAPWDSAQAASLPRSQQLANELATSFNGQRIPLVVGRVSVSPIDSMTCPAVAVEIAPEKPGVSLSADTYLQQVAESIVTALTFWRQHAQAQIAAAEASTSNATPATAQPGAPAVAPKPRPRPKPAPIVSPEEEPLSPADSTRPAPIVRRPPAATTPGTATPPPTVPQ